MKKSIVKAQVTGGKYHDNNYMIEIGRTSQDSNVYCNGKKLPLVQSVNIKIRVGHPTKVVIVSAVA